MRFSVMSKFLLNSIEFVVFQISINRTALKIYIHSCSDSTKKQIKTSRISHSVISFVIDEARSSCGILTSIVSLTFIQRQGQCNNRLLHDLSSNICWLYIEDRELQFKSKVLSSSTERIAKINTVKLLNLNLKIAVI